MKKTIIVFLILLLIIASFYFFKNKNINFKKIPEILENKANFLINKKNNQQQNQLQQDVYVYQPIFQGLNLELIEPQNNIVVNNSSLKIKGKTNPKVEVFVNEKELISDEKGEFETVLTLDEGENVITIVASDDKGNYAEKELVVTLETVE